MQLIAGCLSILWIFSSAVAGNPDRVRLEDLKVLTLYQGHVTTARRSHPVQQLKCVGGTAGCSTFVPQVVQCYNRGSNGYDVQWECKTDMDNAYRFGHIVVSCEGYDYPDDPYILRGSCGLEYNLDLTKEGYQKQNPHRSPYGKTDSDYGGTAAGVVIFIIALIVVGTVFRMCMTQNHHNAAEHQDMPPPYPGYTVPPSAPPPPGFRSDYMPTGADYASSSGWQQPPQAGCSSSSSSGWQQPPPHQSRTDSGPGFWSGAATGGILGYLFGSRGQNRAHYGMHSPPQPTNSWWSSNSNTGWGSGNTAGWGSSSSSGFGSSTSSGWGSSSSPSSSSGTRTASGFGGTRRR